MDDEKTTLVPLGAIVRALLFYKAAPISRRELVLFTGKKQEDIDSALVEIREKEKGSGLTLVDDGNHVELCTDQRMGEVLARMDVDIQKRELSDVALETLSLIVYAGPITRAEIDYIRGVNSQYILRTLAMRGLIEKKPFLGDNRNIHYGPTVDLLAFLGVSSVEALPEFEAMRKELLFAREAEVAGDDSREE